VDRARAAAKEQARRGRREPVQLADELEVTVAVTGSSTCSRCTRARPRTPPRAASCSTTSSSAAWPYDVVGRSRQKYTNDTGVPSRISCQLAIARRS
jgi:hypothetical protein